MFSMKEQSLFEKNSNAVLDNMFRVRLISFILESR